MLFWRLADKPDSVVVGVAYDGRKYAELENIPGPLTKYLPLYCHYEERMSFCDLLERIKTIANDAYTWQEYFTWEHHQQILTQAGGKTALPFGFDFYEQPALSCRQYHARALALVSSFPVFQGKTCLSLSHRQASNNISLRPGSLLACRYRAPGRTLCHAA